MQVGDYKHTRWTKDRKADCHPEEKHYGLGLCYKCYYQQKNNKQKDYYKKRYREKWKEIRSNQKERRWKYKMTCLEHYGGNPPRCACCQEMNLEFLTIDHINNNGAEHRKTMRGQNFYSWVIKNNFPDDLRVLCMNCNWARGKFGYCPHTLPEDKTNGLY